jgi:hypothetical protein
VAPQQRPSPDVGEYVREEPLTALAIAAATGDSSSAGELTGGSAWRCSRWLAELCFAALPAA